MKEVRLNDMHANITCANIFEILHDKSYIPDKAVNRSGVILHTHVQISSTSNSFSSFLY